MTLRELQGIIKYGLVGIVLLVYGGASFVLGQVTVHDEVKVKGESTRPVKEEKIVNPLPYADIQSPEIIPSTVKLCSNTTLGYEIAYPSDWFTTYNSEDQKCLYFAPYSFVVPEFIDYDFAPIIIETIKAQDWQDTLKFYENPNELYNVISSENLEIAGRLVKKIESKSTGEGNYPRGFKSTHFLIFDGEKPVRLSYSQLDEGDNTEEIENVLEEIANNFKYI